MTPKPHIALWAKGAYPPIWGVWWSREDCRRGDPPAALSYFFDTIRRIDIFIKRSAR